MIKTIFRESLRGKSIGRTLTNRALAGREFSGAILDIGGKKKPASHYRFLRIAPDADIKTVNIDLATGADYILDVTKEILPVEDNSQDAVLCFNTLEHLSSWGNVLAETRRVLKPGGTFFGSIPFLVGVHADPHDYIRMTAQGLQKAFADARFSDIEITPVGKGPFTAAFAQVDHILPGILSALLAPLFLTLDWCVRKMRPGLQLENKYVLAYIFECRKDMSR